MGYTSQAGAVAGATFAYALMVSVIVGRLDRAKIVIEAESTDSPWKPKQLCRMEVENIESESKIIGELFSNEDRENEFATLYSLYNWLCKIKHPTMRSVQHDAGSTSLKANEYVIMAAPDVGVLDLFNKFKVISILIGRVHSALRRFALAMQLDQKNSRVIDWYSRFNSIIPASLEAYKTLEKLEIPVRIKINRE